MKTTIIHILSVVVLSQASTALAADIVEESTREECKPKAFIIPLPYKKGSAEVHEVLEGKTFTNKDSVNISGTMPNNGAVTITPSFDHQNIPAGYHNGFGEVVGANDLESGNIKSGATIFGVAGDPNVVDTTSGSATASDIIQGKTAWVKGELTIGARRTPICQEVGSNCSGESGNCEYDKDGCARDNTFQDYGDLTYQLNNGNPERKRLALMAYGSCWGIERCCYRFGREPI